MQNKNSVKQNRARCLSYLINVILMTCIIAYFFGNSPIGRFFTSREAVGKSLFLLLSVSAATGCSWLISRYTNYYDKWTEFSWKQLWLDIKARFQIERVDVILLILIVAVGLILRYVGITWGTRSIFQPDEENLVKPAINMAMTHYPYHGDFRYPGQFASKIVAVLIMIYSAITGTVITESTISCYFLFRMAVAAFSALTIVTAFLIGNYLHKHLGIFLGLLVMLYPEYVSLAKQVTGDTVVFCLLSMVLLCSLMYMETNHLRWVCFMSFLTAMATMEKWHAAVGCFFIALVVIVQCHNWLKILKQGLIAFGSYVAGMFLVAPNMLWDIHQGLGGIEYMYQYEPDVENRVVDLLYAYIGKIPQYVGISFLVLFTIGMLCVIVRHKKEYLILSLGIMKLTAICFLNRAFTRWGLEFYFTVLLVTAIGIHALLIRDKEECCGTAYEQGQSRKRQSSKKDICRRVAQCMGAVLATLVMTCMAVGTALALVVATHSEQDTRLVQERFCERQGITPENSAYDYYTAFDPGGIRDGVEKLDRKQMNRLYQMLGEESGELYLRREGIRYAVDVNGYKDSRETRFLPESCPVLLKLTSEIPDFSNWPVNSVEASWNEIGIIRGNMKRIRQVLEGAPMGFEITVYDVSELPVRIE